MKNSFTVAGNVGNAELKQAGASRVLKFSVAENLFKFNSETKKKEEAGTQWWNCDLWINSDEYENFATHIIQKGKPVYVQGSLETREYEGKTYITVKVSNVFPDPANVKK